LNPSRRIQIKNICPECDTENEYTDGFYKAEVIEPHGYVAPVHYFRCKNCKFTYKGG
jgi:rubredoxin